MCGRFTLRTPAAEIARLFQLDDVPDMQPRYNITPSQRIAAIRRRPEHRQRELAMFRWGLVPSWADDPKIGYKMINARAETVASKPAYRQALSKRRCLIVADGFYEWQKTDGRKQPYWIHLKDCQPFAFAGLWECWHRGDETLESATVITTEANELVQPIHDRMPVILRPEDYDVWIDPDFHRAEALQELLVPCAAEEMAAYAVSEVVNNPRNEGEQCLEPREG